MGLRLKSLVASGLLTGLAVVAITGCLGGGGDGPKATDTIEYLRAGGVSDSNQFLRIEPDGAATITTGSDPDDDPGVSEHEFQVGEPELADLREHLSDVDLGALNDGITTCGGCFSFELGWGDESAVVDENSRSDEFEVAAAPLDDIIESELPGEGPIGGG